ncbi:DUF1697 domain-containing protein [Deinococcus sp.]|uniref:DUF1697 domain-containing protein n=1 Tax=Deinococcus sp. TaxID=47478 RepID=UPI0025D364B1|nr:DUF1697 domain-containing protein [Deinococcus sp.]
MSSSLHIALLRGVNVGGHRKVPMLALRAVFESLGLKQVQTYIQSGNAVYAGQISREPVEAALEAEFGFAVAVLLRSAAEWADMTERNPYPLQAAQDGSKVQLALLDAEPGLEGVAAMMAVQSGADEWVLSGRELFMYTPNGLGRSKLDPQRLRVGATTRNWRTVTALSDLLDTSI